MAATQNPSSPFAQIRQLVHIPQRSRENITSTPKSLTSTPVLLFSSAVAGGVEAIATYPFEYAKTRVQLHTVPCPHHNPFSIIYNVAKYEGISTLIRAALPLSWARPLKSLSALRLSITSAANSLTSMEHLHRREVFSPAVWRG